MILPVNYDAISPKVRRLVREEYARMQDGKCCLCEASLDGPPSAEVGLMKIPRRLFPIGFFKNPIHLHHDHNTGMTIGAVHAECNAVVWVYCGE